MVTFELFVRPAIARMMGHTAFQHPALEVRVLDDIDNRGGRRSFLRAIVSRQGEEYVAKLTGPQGSGILTSMSLANALLVVPDDRPRVEAGETLHALPLGEDAQLATTFAL